MRSPSTVFETAASTIPPLRQTHYRLYGITSVLSNHFIRECGEKELKTILSHETHENKNKKNTKNNRPLARVQQNKFLVQVSLL